jgi:hypothetical protein
VEGCSRLQPRQTFPPSKQANIIWSRITLIHTH